MIIDWRKIKFGWKQLSIESRGSIAISIPLTCLIITVIIYSLFRQSMIAAQIYVDHTNHVLVESQSTLINLLNAETGVRGYYIGKQPVFLEPYDLALTNLEPSLAKLNKLIQDNPAQVPRVKTLTEIAKYRMNLLRETIQRVNQGEPQNATSINKRLLQGKKSMDQFRKIITEVESEELRLLEIRTQSLQNQQNLNIAVSTRMKYNVPSS
jgi:CHASE3 domain sensor protein